MQSVLHPPMPTCSTHCTGVQAIKEGPSWAVDAWGWGCLQEVYSGRPLARTEDLRNTGPMKVFFDSSSACMLY